MSTTSSEPQRVSTESPGARGHGAGAGAHLALVESPTDDSLAVRLEAELARASSSLAGVRGADPVDERDAALTLLRVHDLHVGPFAELVVGPNRQHHPVIADLKWRLEAAFLERLEELDSRRAWDLPGDPRDALRAIQSVDRVPPLYRWLAEEADEWELRAFLELEGGPDGGFDDLVAHCQLGVEGEAKVELARNYWDEMGRGDGSRVHTELHRTMADALGLRRLARGDQPGACLERTLLGSTLATNRWLQPEMVGALGLIELQAGPRCRAVVAALRRTGAPAAALPFYEEHARVDPQHGRSWLSRVVGPLVDEHPDVAWRVVRGARWRSTVNARFLEAAQWLLVADAAVHRPGSGAPTGVPTAIHPERVGRRVGAAPLPMTTEEWNAPPVDPTGGPADGDSAAPVPAPADQPATPSGPAADVGADRSPDGVVPTRTSGVWTAAVGATVLLLVLAIFVGQNTQRAEISFLAWHGRAPTPSCCSSLASPGRGSWPRWVSPGSCNSAIGAGPAASGSPDRLGERSHRDVPPNNPLGSGQGRRRRTAPCHRPDR